MEIKYSKIHKYDIGYTNKQEFDILKDEIFNQEIYKLDLHTETPVIFDLGSHIGLSILYFKMIYPRAKISGFEPNSNIFPLLEENIYCSNLQDIELHNIALGNTDEIRALYIDNQYDAFSTSSFKKNAWNGKQPSVPVSVKVKQLSQYINEDIDLIKMDVEGAEKEILQELITANRLRNIKNMIIECHNAKQTAKTILSMLQAHGFKSTVTPDRYDEDLICILAQNISNKSA